MLVMYLSITRQQGSAPAVWVVAALVLGAAAAGYGATRAAPCRRTSLVLGGLVLMALGLLAILTIGLPILIAGGLCLIALVRTVPVPVEP